MEENEDKVEQASKKLGQEIEKETAKIGKRAAKEGSKKLMQAVAKLLITLISNPVVWIIGIIVLCLVLLASMIHYISMDDANKLTAYGKYSINQILGLDDISELVTINGTPEKGYKLAFVDDIDVKLQKVIDSDEQYAQRGITEPDILKQYIKAELVTQLPYLGDGIPASELPNLDGIDILYEPEKTANMLNSMEGVLMIGDSYTVGVRDFLSEATYRCRTGVSPSYWNNDERIKGFPDDATAVCILLGVNNPYEITDMQQLISKMVEKYPGKPIYVQKVFPLGILYRGAVTQEQIDAYNTAIESYCKGLENVFWIDTTAGCVDESGYLISNDGLHPSNYQTFASNIKRNILKEYGGDTSSSVELSGATVEEQVWSFFINQGWTEVATAAIMGNMYAESGLIPNRVQGSNINDPENGPGPAAGIVQWENYNTKSSRWASMSEYCSSKGKDWRDLQCQLEYVQIECEGSIWECASYWPSDYACTFEEFKTCNDSSQLELETNRFCACFEKCYQEDANMEGIRIPKAKEFYEMFTGTTPAPSGGSKTKKAMAVTDREVAEENTFQPAVKLKRVMPNKTQGELSEAEGMVIQMTYVPQGVFNAYLNQQNPKVMEVFTINNNREVVFVKQSYNSNAGSNYSKASSVNIETVMEKYSMPYDYLMMFNVYGNDVEFCLGLADLAINSEYIIAIQDQVTTTRTVVHTTETITILDQDKNAITSTREYNNSTEIVENSSQDIQLTYADSWAVTVRNEITYKDDEVVEREDVPMNSVVSDPVVEPSGSTVFTTDVTTETITNRYNSGETTVYVENAGDKFVELYKKAKYFKLAYPEWLFEALNSNVKTVKMVDLTKYLLYRATKNNYGAIDPEEIFTQFKNNQFKTVKKQKKGTIGWAFIRAWENNELRKFIEDDESIDYKSSPNIYLYVTEDKKKYILHDEIGKEVRNKIYGIDVKTYRNEVGLGWQNVNLFAEQGIDIKQSEFNVYGESTIDVETIENISVKAWENMKDRVDVITKTKNLDLESNQTDCLIDILYEYGGIKGPTKVREVISTYIQYGLNEEEFKKLEPFKGPRGNARWVLFSEGIYNTPIATEQLDPSDYAGAGGEILEVAEQCWQWVCEHNPTYGGCSIPPGSTIDCSGYVTWVLYEMGYTQFSYQWNTQMFIQNQEMLKNELGWEIIPISRRTKYIRHCSTR